MERINVEVVGEGMAYHLSCPCCDNWEEIGVDDPRKMLYTLPLIEWKENTTNGNELSIHQCTECNGRFEIEWNY